MLKKFFISMLGSLAALWLSLGILVFGTIFCVSILVAKTSMNDADVSAEKILHVKLIGDITDRESDPSLSDLWSIADDETDNLETMISALAEAKGDKMIKGVYIECCGSSMGVASRSELIEAIQDFKKSGKWVYAYADNYMQGDYYVATAADEVYLNPVGETEIQGLSTTVMFYKDLLDKLGVELQVVRVGSFKSAVEPYLRMDMSEESRLQTKVFLGEIWGDVCKTIAENRGVAPADVNMWADSLAMLWDQKRYVENKVVSKLMYRSEVEDAMRKLVGVKDDAKLPLVTPTEYMAARNIVADATKDEHIAVLYAVGDISDTGDDGISSEKYVPEILKLAKDDKVKAMVLRVNSPGGSAFASEQIWKALEDFKATGKPLYVSMGDYAASGGYYISCGADKIYSDAATLTGSIGIFGVIPSAQKLIEDKIGIGIDMVETNADASIQVPFFPLNQPQYDGMQAYVERGYELFTSRVAQGRELPIDSVKAIGGGRVWDGQSALKIGLVDEIGSLTATINALNKQLGKNYKTVGYPACELGFIAELMRQGKKNAKITVPGYGDITYAQYNKVRKIIEMSPLQARMQTIIIK